MKVAERRCKNNEKCATKMVGVCTDASEASKMALDYMTKKGIVVFSREVMSIFRKYMTWSVEIESPKFTGVIMINSRTGEVIKEVTL